MPSPLHLPSPNFNARDPSVPLGLIVLHYTGMKTANAALERLCDPSSQVSAHYVVDEDGTVYALVDEAQRAWHAGQSFWRGATDINSASIGIELVNPGHQNGYRAFPDAQIMALKPLLRSMMERHALPPSALLAHSDVAPDRKDDPGERFPWRMLAEDGLGLWPVPTDQDRAPADDAEVQRLLAAVGYVCPQGGHYDRATRAALLAFQRHYHPDNLTGTPEAETVARLKALARLSA